MNQVMQTIESRSSIRAYADTPLTVEEIQQIKRAALCSPTARNSQEEIHCFITRRELIDEIERITLKKLAENADEATRARLAERKQGIFYGAPLVVATFAPKGHRFSDVNAGIAVMSMALCAKSMGLESVIIGIIDQAFETERGRDIIRELGLREDMRFSIAIAIGHGAATKEPHAPKPEQIIDIA